MDVKRRAGYAKRCINLQIIHENEHFKRLPTGQDVLCNKEPPKLAEVTGRTDRPSAVQRCGPDGSSPDGRPPAVRRRCRTGVDALYVKRDIKKK